MSEHTPGPWTFEPEDYSMNKVRSASGLVAQVIGDSAEAEANARLIAAAPEMLEALEVINLLVGNIDHSRGHGPNAAKMRGDILNSIRDIAQTAITKAKGLPK